MIDLLQRVKLGLSSAPAIRVHLGVWDSVLPVENRLIRAKMPKHLIAFPHVTTQQLIRRTL